MKLPIISIITICLFVLLPAAISAQDSSDSAAERLREAVREKVQETIQDTTVSRPAGAVGIIEQVNDKLIVLSSPPEKLTITTTSDTEYLKFPGKRKIERDELEIGHHAIIIGTLNNQSGEIEAKVIQLIEEPEIPEQSVFYGKLTEINKSNYTVINSENEEWTITPTNKTDYLSKSLPPKLTAIKANSLSEDDLVIIGGTPDSKKENTLQAFFILRLPNLITEAPEEAL